MTRIWIYKDGEPPDFVDVFLTPEECQTAIDNVSKIFEGEPRNIRHEVEVLE